MSDYDVFKMTSRDQSRPQGSRTTESNKAGSNASDLDRKYACNLVKVHVFTA